MAGRHKAICSQSRKIGWNIRRKRQSLRNGHVEAVQKAQSKSWICQMSFHPAVELFKSKTVTKILMSTAAAAAIKSPDFLQLQSSLLLFSEIDCDITMIVRLMLSLDVFLFCPFTIRRNGPEGDELI